jgi:hypothetical protein
MDTVNGKIALLEVPEAQRTQLINEARKRLHQKAIEARMWRWLLDVNKLTVNGCVVFSDNHQTRKPQGKKKRRAR